MHGGVRRRARLLGHRRLAGGGGAGRNRGDPRARRQPSLDLAPPAARRRRGPALGARVRAAAEDRRLVPVPGFLPGLGAARARRRARADREGRHRCHALQLAARQRAPRRGGRRAPDGGSLGGGLPRSVGGLELPHAADAMARGEAPRHGVGRALRCLAGDRGLAHARGRARGPHGGATARGAPPSQRLRAGAAGRGAATPRSLPHRLHRLAHAHGRRGHADRRGDGAARARPRRARGAARGVAGALRPRVGGARERARLEGPGALRRRARACRGATRPAARRPAAAVAAARQGLPHHGAGEALRVPGGGPAGAGAAAGGRRGRGDGAPRGRRGDRARRGRRARARARGAPRALARGRAHARSGPRLARRPHA